MALTSNAQNMHDKLNATLNLAIDCKDHCETGITMANGYGATKASTDLTALAAALGPFIAILQAEVATYNDVGNEG